MMSNPFDQASRYTAKLDPLGFLRWLMPRLPASIVFRHWLDTRTVPFPGEPDRTCDTVAGLEDETQPGVWWAVPIEFQGRPDPLLFGRLLEYLARVWLQLRPPESLEDRYQLVAAVVNLTGVGRSSRDMELGQTGVRTCLKAAERNLAQEDAALTLVDIAEGRLTRCLLPFIPLMRGGAEAAIMEQWKVLAQAEPDPRRRADYAGLALVFAELTDCRSAWQQALEGWNVEQSQQVLEWQAEAEKRGEARGEARGKAEGKAEGRAEGKAEGRAEGLLLVLRRRFPSAIPAELESAILRTRDLTQLNQWFDAALSVTTLEEFRRVAQL